MAKQSDNAWFLIGATALFAAFRLAHMKQWQGGKGIGRQSDCTCNQSFIPNSASCPLHSVDTRKDKTGCKKCGGQRDIFSASGLCSKCF